MAGHTKEVDSSEAWGGNGSPFKLSYGKQMMWFFLVSDALTFGGLLCAYGFFRHQFGTWPVGEEVFNAMPFLGNGYPLLYVALMTFILIVSSVTMVLAVEAGHRLDKKAVIKWLTWTVIGGFFFVGSQAWEWAHFIHGSEHGAILTPQLMNDGWATIKDGAEMGFANMHLVLDYGHGQVFGGTAEEAVLVAQYMDAPMAAVQGANMYQNEYAPMIPQFANLFFFITGFHGFHVMSGVVINLIVLLNVRAGVYDDRGHFEMVEKVGLYWHFVDLVWVFVFTFFYLV
ncbi:MAG: cytochrome c oxidase subunit 3 [Flavobacteriales bacterium]|jgi:cytochrome c oxidase subunit 3